MRALGLAGVPELPRIRAFKRDESEAEKFVGAGFKKIVFCGKDAPEKIIDVLQSAGAAKAIFIQIQRV